MINCIVQTPDGERYNLPMLPSFTFSGGEPFVRMDFSLVADIPPFVSDAVRIIVATRIQSCEELIKLGLVVNAIDNHFKGTLIEYHICIPYLFMSRQDRVVHEGDPNGAEFMANYLSSMTENALGIFTLDVHSGRNIKAFQDYATHISDFTRLELFSAGKDFKRFKGYDIIVAPDAGAAQENALIAEHNGSKLVTFEKVRDTRSGEITGMRMINASAADVEGKRCLIVDDICDGGRTFIEAGSVLKKAGSKEVDLYVTHGIFSKGFDVFDGCIDNIFTTDAFRPDIPIPSNVTVINLIKDMKA